MIDKNNVEQVLNDWQLAKLKMRLPDEAVKTHDSKPFLSSINSAYVTERFNDVFGVGMWQIRLEVVAEYPATGKKGPMIVIKTIFTVPFYGIYYECYGGHDNSDQGDAYKSATTDGLTKIGSWLGIGLDVWKDKQKAAPHDKKAPPQSEKKVSRNDRAIQLIRDRYPDNPDGTVNEENKKMRQQIMLRREIWVIDPETKKPKPGPEMSDKDLHNLKGELV